IDDLKACFTRGGLEADLIWDDDVLQAVEKIDLVAPARPRGRRHLRAPLGVLHIDRQQSSLAKFNGPFTILSPSL
ncbi:MAG: hypothetical protein AAF580_12515, partial [Pseudomonadota bacterium]